MSMEHGMARLRMDLRIEALRLAVQNAVSVRAEDIRAQVDAAVASFDMEGAIREAVHRELERAIRASVEHQLSEAVRVPVSRAVTNLVIGLGRGHV